MPISDKSAKTVSNAIMGSLYGAPQTICMDQGSEFNNYFLKTMLEGLDVSIKVGHAHYNQSNPVERFHRTLWALLRAKKSNGENDWERSLPTLIMAYNATQHYSTLCSPSRVFLGIKLNLPYFSLLPKFKPENVKPPTPHSLEESLDFVIDLMRNSDAVRIRRQFKAYSKPSDDIKPGDQIYAAVLLPPGNTRKLQIKWSGPLVVLENEILNPAMLKIQEIGVRNPRIYTAHRSKVRMAKHFGQKDVDPLFKLPRLPRAEMEELSQELEEFELPGKQDQNDVIDEIWDDVTNHARENHDDSTAASSTVSSSMKSSRGKVSNDDRSSEDHFLSFHQSPGSTGSDLDQVLQGSSADEEPVSAASQAISATSQAAGLVLEPELVSATSQVEGLVPEPEHEKETYDPQGSETRTHP